MNNEKYDVIMGSWIFSWFLCISMLCTHTPGMLEMPDHGRSRTYDLNDYTQVRLPLWSGSFSSLPDVNVNSE